LDLFILRGVTAEFLDVFIAGDLSGIFWAKKLIYGAALVEVFILRGLRTNFLDVFILDELTAAA
jgi:hypothetical protein